MRAIAGAILIHAAAMIVAVTAYKGIIDEAAVIIGFVLGIVGLSVLGRGLQTEKDIEPKN